MILAIHERQRSAEELEAIRRAAIAFDLCNGLYPAVLHVWSRRK